jgi:Leucine-rich repeat (LRR) protein
MRKAKVLLCFILISSLPFVLEAQFGNCRNCACLYDIINQDIKDYNFIEAAQIVGGSSGCFDKKWLYTSMILGAYKDASDSIRLKNLEVLNNIYFYKDRFGLAYDVKTKKYGFIDKNMNVKLPFQYDEAEPFANDGWGAIVKRNNTYFLIDSLGNEYNVATKLNQLNQATKALVLRDTDFQALPSSIGMYKKLEIIILSRHSYETHILKELPVALGRLENLRILNVFYHPYIQIPKELGNLQKLEKLILSYCQLKDIPKEIGNLKNLTYLDISNNQLEYLPIELGQLSQLQILNLEQNKILSLPPTFGKFKKLTELNLYKNALKNLPNELKKLINLRSLLLHSNQLTTIPTKLGNLKKLEYLDLSDNHVIIIPKELGKLKSLKNLYLNNNKINLIPKELGKLKSLENFYLGYNSVNIIPIEIGDLSKLILLDLSNNKLQSIPKELGRLRKLKTISLNNNEIKTIPIEFFGLQALKSLNVSDNKLENLPSEACSLPNLTHLDATNNQLINIPKDIGNLKKLEVIRISGNKITELPSSLCNLPMVRYLDLIDKNPLKTIPNCVTTLIKSLEPDYATPPEMGQILMSPTDSLLQAAQTFFSEKSYSESYKSMLLSAKIDSTNYNTFFSLSFYALFIGEYKKAIEAAQKTLSLNPNAVSVETNLALGYLLDNQYNKAELIYKKWKGRKFTSNDNELAEKIFLQDIKDLDNAGVIPKERMSDIERIKKLLEN